MNYDHLIVDEILPQNIRLPRNVDAEAALLGALMIDNRLIKSAAEILAPDDFHSPLLGRIFKLLLKLDDGGRAATPVTLKPMLEHDTGLKELGGAAFLAELTGNTAVLIGAMQFAHQIATLSARRKSMLAIVDGLERLEDVSEDYEDTLDIVEAMDDRVRLATSRDERFVTRSVKSATETARERARLADSGVEIGATCRTVPQLDEIIGKVERSTLNVLAGRPGQGKTTLAMSAAIGYAINGFATEFFHYEMSSPQLDLRVVSDISEMIGRPISHATLKKGAITQDDLRTLEMIDDIQALLPIEFTEMKNGTDISRLESMIVRAKRKWEKRKKKLWCVWIDYANLVGASSDGKPIEDDTKRLNAVIKRLDEMKQRHDIAIFLLAQLSREVDRRADKRPMMSDLKGSGAFEEKGDSVFFAYRPEYYLEQAEPVIKEGPDYIEWQSQFQRSRDKMEIIGGKNRHGAPCTRTARFIKDNYAIRSLLRDTDRDEPLVQKDLLSDDVEEIF